jgi:hypothetical protein
MQPTQTHACTYALPEHPLSHKEETFITPDDGMGVAPKKDRSTISHHIPVKPRSQAQV